MKKRMYSLAAVVLIAAFGYLQQHRLPGASPGSAEPQGSTLSTRLGDDSALTRAIRSRSSNVQVEGRGVVFKVLPDDNKGSRHQRFLLRLSSGDTLLVAHNIDLAPRIPDLVSGDEIGFSGEYEWTERGGVVHWTHHDPAGRHPGGWLRRGDRTYQ